MLLLKLWLKPIVPQSLLQMPKPVSDTLFLKIIILKLKNPPKDDFVVNGKHSSAERGRSCGF